MEGCESPRKIAGKSSYSKFFWKKNDSGSGGVGVLVAGKWIDKIILVVRHSTKFYYAMITLRKINNQLCVCAPQPGLYGEEKDCFYEQLLIIVISIASSETLVKAGDLNGHVRHHSQGFSRHHGEYGYETRNQEGIRILDLCAANDLAFTNTLFRKRNSRLVTYSSGGCPTQIDHILVRRTGLKLVTGLKFMVKEVRSSTSQQILVVEPCR